MQIEIDGRYEILSRNRLNNLNNVSHPSQAIHDNCAVTVATAQKVIVGCLESFLSNNVARLKAAALVLRKFELPRTDLADVSQNMSQQTILGIVTLRALFDMEQRKLQRMSFNPGEVLNRRVFLDQYRLVGGISADFTETLLQIFGVEIQRCR